MTEIETLLNMDYEECYKYLLKKYGKVPGDYFKDEECTKKNTKVTRGNEGLYIHHIDEYKAILLSTPSFARRYPFEFQKADRLVYANLLEHLVLHIKIYEYYSSYGYGGIYDYLVPELNDIYSGVQYKQPWKQKVVELVLPLKDDYFLCIKKIITIDSSRPVLTSFIHNEEAGIWNPKNNEPLYKEMKNLGVKF